MYKKIKIPFLKKIFWGKHNFYYLIVTISKDQDHLYFCKDQSIFL